MKKYAFLRHKKDKTNWFSVWNPEVVYGPDPEIKAEVLDSSDGPWMVQFHYSNRVRRVQPRYFLLTFWEMFEYDTQEEMIGKHLGDIL